jgi:predicted AAA+ superfamily ATPase
MAELSTDEIPIIEKLVEFVGKAEVDGINYTSLSKNLGITKYKAGRYVELLNKSFILNTVMPFGTNVLKEPKVLMSLPYRLLFKEYGPAIGPLREDFFAEAMTMSGRRFFYLKSSRGAKTPDFLVQDVSGEIVIEVGGKGKGRKRFKDLVSKEKIVLTHSDDSEGDKRPLFIIGYQ